MGRTQAVRSRSLFQTSAWFVAVLGSTILSTVGLPVASGVALATAPATVVCALLGNWLTLCAFKLLPSAFLVFGSGFGAAEIFLGGIPGGSPARNAHNDPQIDLWVVVMT